MRAILFLTVFVMLGCSDDKKSSAEHDSASEGKACEGTEGKLIGVSFANKTPAPPTDTSADSSIASITVEGNAKLGKLFCLTITILDAEGKPVAAKAGGQTLIFSKRDFSTEDDKKVDVMQLDKENSSIILTAQHTTVAEGETSVVLSNLFVFKDGKIEIAAGTIKGSVDVAMPDLNNFIAPSLTFTDAGTNKLAIKLKEGQTLDAGYDAYFLDDNSGEVIPAAEGDTAKPALDDTEKHITFSKDVTGDNHVFIFYGKNNTSITVGEAICPYVAGEQVCPAHVRD